MDLFAEQTILTVSRLTALLKDLLEENLCQVWVEGELSNLSRPASGHLYFSLKDSGALLRCVMFRSSAKSLKFRLEEGMALVLRGRVSVYEQRGEYQLVVEYAEPKGVGALQAAFMQLKERLGAEGLFDQARKRPLPILPQRVAVVTSASGAAVHDMLTVLGRRHSSVALLICPVRVQGDGAAAEIAGAIDDLNRLQAADVMIVGRGGGSLEDLWAFNEEIVARAVCRSRIPVVSAVGHETDWTICDFVADLRAPTPSAAAELVCAARDELLQQVTSLGHRLRQAFTAAAALRRQRLTGLQRALHDPSRLLGHLQQRVDDLSERLERAVQILLLRRGEQVMRCEHQLELQHPALRISRLRQELLGLSERAERHVRVLLERYARLHGEQTARLGALSPLTTLARGYAVAEQFEGRRIIRSADQVHPGDRISLRFHDGGARCLVEECYSDSGVKATT